MSSEQQESMAEQSLLVSCDCGYRDVRQGVKAHQKTCGVRIIPAQRRAIEEQEQDAAESGEICLTSLLHPSSCFYIPSSCDVLYKLSIKFFDISGRPGGPVQGSVFDS
jgi:hypothetical protein